MELNKLLEQIAENGHDVKIRVFDYAERDNCEWGVMLDNGKIVAVCRDSKKGYELLYDTPILLLDDKYVALVGMTQRTDNVEGLTTLNQLKEEMGAKNVNCYETCDMDFGWKPLSEAQVMQLVRDFKKNGFNVTARAIYHNMSAWSADMKSGYRDDTNGYHLFTPCGCNPLSFRASSLHELCEDWQTTYVC